MTAGVALIGLNVSLCRLAAFGNDPYSCMNIAVSHVVRPDDPGYGTYQLFVNLVLLIPMFFSYRFGLGLGTIINMVGVGYFADFFMFLLRLAGITEKSISPYPVVRVAFILIAMFCLTFGAALYLECGCGAAPYDALGYEIEEWTGRRIPFSIARILLDVLCVGISLAAGGWQLKVIGLCTAFGAFGTGPFVSFFRKHAAHYIVYGRKVKNE